MVITITENSKPPVTAVGPSVLLGTFKDLTDTPSSYAGGGGRALVVRQDELGLELVPATGTGDMTKATYDTTNNGIVDNSERLNGQLAEYYATASDVAYPSSQPLVPQTTPPEHSEGRIYYNAVSRTFNFQGPFPGIEVKAGHENHMHIINNSGVTILKGKGVRQAGVDINGIPQIELAQANSFDNARLLGITSHDIPDGAESAITTFGEITNIDTSAVPVGVPLYLSATTPGAFTEVAPDIVTRIGGALQADPITGSLFVYIINNKSLPAISGALLGSTTGAASYSVTTVAQDLDNYNTADSIVVLANTSTGELTLPHTGRYNIQFVASMSFPTLNTTRSVTFEVYNGETSTILFSYVANIPRDAATDSISFSWPISAAESTSVKIRVKASEDILITFVDKVFSTNSISLQ